MDETTAVEALRFQLASPRSRGERRLSIDSPDLIGGVVEVPQDGESG